MKKMKCFCFSFLIVILVLYNSYASDMTKLRSEHTLCPDTEGVGWGHHRTKLRLNYATYPFDYEFLSPDEWWSEEKPMWGIQYEMGLGKKSSVGFNVGGGSVKEQLPAKEKSITGLNLFYKVCWKGEGILPEGGIVGYILPQYLPISILVVDIFSSYYYREFFSYVLGVRCQPVGGNGAIPFPVPAGFFGGISVSYKKVTLLVEYRRTGFELTFGRGGMFLGGINFCASHQLTIGLKYVSINYEDQEERDRGGTPAYSERWGMDLILSFERKKK